MIDGFRSLSVISRVGESIVGSSLWGSRFQRISVGRAIPSLKKSEDADAMVRCGFLDPSLPIELNMVSVDAVRVALRQRLLLDPTESGSLDPETLLRSHPTIGYLPPELFSAPNVIGLRALEGSGASCKLVALSRLNESWSQDGAPEWAKVRSSHLRSDAAFWKEIAGRDLYPRLIGELLSRGEGARLSLIAPPVPVLHEDWVSSADLQHELNIAAATLLKPVSGSSAGIRPLYALHIHPSALHAPAIVQRALERLRLALTTTEFGFMGVHLNFLDLGAVNQDGATSIRVAKELAAKVAGIARDTGRFTVVSDAGPVGPAFLDSGAAFTTYAPGMTMRRTYPFVKAPKEQTRAIKKRLQESKCGLVLGGPWNYSLLRYRDVRAQGWRLEEVAGKAANEVPATLRGAEPWTYRVNFSKPYNTAVQEVLNDARDRELNGKKNARPGSSILGRSEDPSIAPWAA